MPLDPQEEKRLHTSTERRQVKEMPFCNCGATGRTCTTWQYAPPPALLGIFKWGSLRTQDLWQRPGTSEYLRADLLVWARWRGEIWGQGQGPGHIQTLKITSLLCKPAVIAAQNGAPFLLKLKYVFTRRLGIGRAPGKVPTAWATSSPIASSRSHRSWRSLAGWGLGGPLGQTVSNHAEHSTWLHSRTQSEMYSWV